MEQPRTPNAPPSDQSALPKDAPAIPSANTTTSTNNKKRPPTPEQVLAHYESQGLDARAASLKAISDLQILLFRSSARANKDRSLTADAASRKLDSLNTRLAILEMKLDSKPGFPESFAIGIASGGFLHAIGAATPHIAAIWSSVKSATKTPS